MHVHDESAKAQRMCAHRNSSSVALFKIRGCLDRTQAVTRNSQAMGLAIPGRGSDRLAT
jgi:hypothetical protein